MKISPAEAAQVHQAFQNILNHSFSEKNSDALRLVWKRTKQLSISITSYSFHELIPCDILDDARSPYLIGESLLFQFKQIDKHTHMRYHVNYQKKMITLELIKRNMEYQFTLEFSYGDREAYYQNLFDLNQLVPAEGYVIVCVNNNPYNLEFLVCIGTTQNGEAIKKYIQNHNLKLVHHRGIHEIIRDSGKYRKYNIRTLPPKISSEDIVEILSPLFMYRSLKQLQENGYFPCKDDVYIDPNAPENQLPDLS